MGVRWSHSESPNADALEAACEKLESENEKLEQELQAGH